MDSFGQEIFDLKYEICEIESKLLTQDKAKGEFWDDHFDYGVFGVFEVAHITNCGKVYINLRFEGQKSDFYDVAGILGFMSHEEDFIISQAPVEKLPDLCKVDKNGKPVNLQVFRNKLPVHASCWKCKRENSLAYPLSQYYKLSVGDRLLMSEKWHQMSPVRTKCDAPLYDGGYYPANLKFSKSVPYMGIGLEDYLNALLSECKTEMNFRSMTTEKFDLPPQLSTPVNVFTVKPHSTSKAPTKPAEKSRKTKKVNSFRSAIVKSMANKTAEQEQQTAPSYNDQCKEKVENGNRAKPSKHQGNGKTFKRKSKRPGRV